MKTKKYFIVGKQKGLYQFLGAERITDKAAVKEARLIDHTPMEGPYRLFRADYRKVDDCGELEMIVNAYNGEESSAVIKEISEWQ